MTDRVEQAIERYEIDLTSLIERFTDDGNPKQATDWFNRRLVEEHAMEQGTPIPTTDAALIASVLAADTEPTPSDEQRGRRLLYLTDCDREQLEREIVTEPEVAEYLYVNTRPQTESTRPQQVIEAAAAQSEQGSGEQERKLTVAEARMVVVCAKCGVQWSTDALLSEKNLSCDCLERCR
jgi:hypothetical protein